MNVCVAGVDVSRREHGRRGAGAGLRGRGDRLEAQPARARLRAETPAHAAQAQRTGWLQSEQSGTMLY